MPPRDHQTPQLPHGCRPGEECQDERDGPLQRRQGEERRGEERHDDPTGEQRGEDDEERQVTGGGSTAFVLCHSGKAIDRSAWPTHERNVVGAGQPALATTAYDQAGSAYTTRLSTYEPASRSKTPPQVISRNSSRAVAPKTRAVGKADLG